MTNIAKLIKISPGSEYYIDANQSYKEIYNLCLAKGAEQLEPEWMGGNPIQLDTKNMNSFYDTNKHTGNSEYTEYYIQYINYCI